MRIEIVLLFIIVFQCANLKSEEKSVESLFEKRKLIMEQHGIFLPDELLVRLKRSKVIPPEAGFKSKDYYIDLEPIKFIGEDINYAVGIQEADTSRGDSRAFLVYYFVDSELRMISSVDSYIHSSRDYNFGGYVHRNGLTYEYSDNRLIQVSCLHKPRNIKNALDIEKKQYCGDQIEINENSDILNVKFSGEKCVDDCIRGYPYRFPGYYYAMGSIVNMRSTPNLNGEVIAKLPRGEKVEVLEDTGKRDFLPNPLISANWLKVKTQAGQEGYIHGAYLRAPAEPDIYEIKRKAEEWKKANKK